MECALQRAENVAALVDEPQGSGTWVLELCVGPSLKALASAYRSVGIEFCYGNDIDPQWEQQYPKGLWLIGDAIDTFNEQHFAFDAVVFAPPLSKGCSGRREDALSIFEVAPSYLAFMEAVMDVRYHGLVVLTLPGRSKATKHDREQLNYLKHIVMRRFDVEEVDLVDGCRKYTDLYMRLRA